MSFIKSTKGKIIIGVLSIVPLYLIICILIGSLSMYKPAPVEVVYENEAAPVLTKIQLQFSSWNVGYAGLGEDCTFFYDAGSSLTSGGLMVRPDEATVDKNRKGIADFLATRTADFLLLQEVDRNSKRSYFNDMYEDLLATMKGYTGAFGYNYKVKRVPVPILNPFNVIGKVESGIATLSKPLPTKVERVSYPGGYSWPKNVFHLNRCFLSSRYSVADNKELVIINTHNSAFDGGILKKLEFEFLKEYVNAEYKKGNYVIIGGDWNQNPPNFGPEKMLQNYDKEIVLRQNGFPFGYFGANWTFGFDVNVATNRSVTAVRKDKSTTYNLIDYYLVSPNVQINRVVGVELGFEHSDHNPIEMIATLK